MFFFHLTMNVFKTPTAAIRANAKLSELERVAHPLHPSFVQQLNVSSVPFTLLVYAEQELVAS
jgi:hypothetical protein